MRVLAGSVVALLLAGCGGEGGGAGSSSAPASAKSSGSAAAPAKSSAAPAASAAPSGEPTAAASASADAGPKKTFACDAVANTNACVEFSGTAHSKEDAVKATCDGDPWKGKLGTEGCPKDGRLGMCTLETGTPQESLVFVYEKGKKTLNGKQAKDEHCKKGDWVDLK